MGEHRGPCELRGAREADAWLGTGWSNSRAEPAAGWAWRCLPQVLSTYRFPEDHPYRHLTPYTLDNSQILISSSGSLFGLQAQQSTDFSTSVLETMQIPPPNVKLDSQSLALSSLLPR